MKNNGLFKAWNIIYPILLYYVISNVVMSLAIWAFGINETNYRESYTMLQTIAVAVSLPVLYGFYRKDQMLFTVFQQRMANNRRELSRQRKIGNAIGALITGALLGLVLNNIIGATGLAEISQGYQTVTTHFYAGGLLFEILGLGILVPLVEELLYRGVVYGRLCDWVGLLPAAVISAVIFGGLHMNLVQFVYTFFMGLFMVFLFEKTATLYGAVLGHIGANLLTVLRTETGILNWMNGSGVVFWGATIVMAVICAVIVLVLWKSNRNSQV